MTRLSVPVLAIALIFNRAAVIVAPAGIADVSNLRNACLWLNSPLLFAAHAYVGVPVVLVDSAVQGHEFLPVLVM